MSYNNDFMEFMGYRNMVVENKIDECLDALSYGEDLDDLDMGDLTDSEIDYLREKINKRSSGRY